MWQAQLFSVASATFVTLRWLAYQSCVVITGTQCWLMSKSSHRARDAASMFGAVGVIVALGLQELLQQVHTLRQARQPKVSAKFPAAAGPAASAVRGNHVARWAT